MHIKRGFNPSDKSQARVFFSYEAAFRAGEKRHASEIINELAAGQNFKVIGAVPQTLFEGLDYWIEFASAPELPNTFRDVPWKPVGQP